MAPHGHSRYKFHILVGLSVDLVKIHQEHLPINVDLVLLTNPMSPGLCLEVILGVPVRIEYDDSVGGGQIDAQTSRSGR